MLSGITVLVLGTVLGAAALWLPSKIGKLEARVDDLAVEVARLQGRDDAEGGRS